MWNIVLVIHLLIALALIIIVLMQRSEGGGLGMGGGGGVMSARSAANAMTKATWFLATAFIVTSLTLTILSARDGENASVVNRLSDQGNATAPVAPEGEGEGLLPPSASDAPLVPSSE